MVTICQELNCIKMTTQHLPKAEGRLSLPQVLIVCEKTATSLKDIRNDESRKL